MQNPQKPTAAIVAAWAMLIIILDTKTAIIGASSGLELCIRTIIPSLFPFIFLSGIINNGLLGQKVTLLNPLGRLCKIPKGSESILLLGFLAGYPVGAQVITQAYRQKQLSEAAAIRMLGFCNNAGPAFLFGIFSVIFSNPVIPWVLWAVHIASALLVGYILPGNTAEICRIKPRTQVSIHTSLQNTIKTISIICGWILLFRIIICFCEKWFLWILPVEIQILFSGLLELSNGCIMLQRIPDEGIRFILASPILAFGGLCVAMQTSSVTQELNCGNYFPGKVLQTLLSLLLSLFLYPLLFQNSYLAIRTPLIMIIIFVISIFIFTIKRKKLWQLQEECSIIPLSDGRKEQKYAVSKKNHPFLQLLPTRRRHG